MSGTEASLATMSDSRRVEAARALTALAVGTYLRALLGRRAPTALLRACAPGMLDWARQPQRRALAERVGEAAVGTSSALAAYHLSTAYTLLLPERMRSGNGVFYTPPAVAERLLDLAGEEGIDWGSASVLDPAAGGGAFVAPVVRRVIATLRRRRVSPARILAHLRTHVRGIEIDPFSAAMSQLFATIVAYEMLGDDGLALPPLVRAADALDPAREHDTPAADLVIGNPPYGRLTLSADQRERFARSLYGHANLYGVFTDLGVRLAKPQGIIALVTPASFLAGQYFANLRRMLREEAAPVALDLITDRSDVFAGVLQETVLVVLRRGAHAREVQVHLNRPHSFDAPCAVTPVGALTLAGNSAAPWILPRAPEDMAVIRGAAGLPWRLRDYGYQVNTGPLVWNRHRSQLANQSGQGRLPLIWAEAVRGPGHFRFGAERRGHVPYFAIEDGQEHLVQRRACILVQRTTAKEQRRRLIAAPLSGEFLRAHGGAVIENHVNVVQNGIAAAPGLDGALSHRAVMVLLNSGVLDQLFRCLNGSVAVSAYELESLPLPGPDTMRALDAMVGAGATPMEIEQFLRAAYTAAAPSAPPPSRPHLDPSPHST